MGLTLFEKQKKICENLRNLRIKELRILPLIEVDILYGISGSQESFCLRFMRNDDRIYNLENKVGNKDQ